MLTQRGVPKVHPASEFAGINPPDEVADDLGNLVNGRAKKINEAGPLPGEGSYSGRATQLDPNDTAPENIAAITRENESAQTLKDLYKIEQNPTPPVGSLKKPDYKINGQYYDNVAPNTSNARNIWSRIKDEKIDSGQTKRIVLNLDDSDVSLNDLRAQFNQWEMPGLEDVIVLKGGQVIPFWEFLH